MNRSWSVLLVCVLAASACDQSLPTASRLAPPDSPPVSASGIVTSTTGGGVFDLSAAGVPNAKFSFSAAQDGDGNASGEFRQYRVAASGLAVDFLGEVTCVSVDPVNHRAWIGGVVKQNNSTDPSFLTSIHEVGDDVWFRVVDYGEGFAAPADRSTVLGFAGAAGIITSEEYCRVRPWPAGDARTWPVIEGNIQVRD